MTSRLEEQNTKSIQKIQRVVRLKNLKSIYDKKEKMKDVQSSKYGVQLSDRGTPGMYNRHMDRCFNTSITNSPLESSRINANHKNYTQFTLHSPQKSPERTNDDQ